MSNVTTIMHKEYYKSRVMIIFISHVMNMRYQVFIHTHTHTRMHTYIHTHTHSHAHTHAHTPLMHARANILTHIHTM